MHKALEVFGLLLAGGLATSFAELKFQYSLVGLIVEKVKSLFGKAKADVSAAAKDVASKV